jgi:predicted nucleotidyltransferase component of viral defense system
MVSYLLLLNKRTDQFILKGGTALARCYGLDRFSEDIDLDLLYA